MQKCVDDVKTWMTVNKLKLSEDKTEAMNLSPDRESRSLSSSFLLPRLCDYIPTYKRRKRTQFIMIFFPYEVVHLFPCLTLSKTVVLHLTVTWPWNSTSPVGSAQPILNSVALVPSIMFCPQTPQTFVSFTPCLLQLSVSNISQTKHKQFVNVCMIIILYIGNAQISILLLCFLYLFVELMITMNE